MANLDKYRKHREAARQRRVDTAPAKSTEWETLASFDVPQKDGRVEIVLAPEWKKGNRSIPAAVRLSLNLPGKRPVSVAIDAETCGQFAELDWLAIMEVCEQQVRLSHVERLEPTPAPAPAPAASSAPAGKLGGGFFANRPAPAPVFTPPAKRWNANLSLAKRIQWLCELAPDYSADWERAEDKDTTDEMVTFLIANGVAKSTPAGPWPVDAAGPV